MGLMQCPWFSTRLAGQWHPATQDLLHGPISFQLSQVLVQPGPQVSYTAPCLHCVAAERDRQKHFQHNDKWKRQRVKTMIRIQDTNSKKHDKTAMLQSNRSIRSQSSHRISQNRWPQSGNKPVTGPGDMKPKYNHIAQETVWQTLTRHSKINKL